MTLTCRVGGNECRKLSHRSRPKAAAFTLVELLVVIGIIAIMISILLPTLSRAREAARASACLNNMRQLSIGIISFAQEHKGWMPGRAGAGAILKLNSDGKPVTGAVTDIPSGDWIAWFRQVDPITNIDSGNAGRNQNITYSALATYLNQKPIVHTTPAQANRVAAKLEEVYRCPSDNLNQRNKWQLDTTKVRYNYSYAVNDLYFMPVQPFDPTDYPAPPTPLKPEARAGGVLFSGKISSIRQPAEKVMIICQDEITADDGVFRPNSAKWANNAGDQVAARHESKYRAAKTGTADPTKNVNARGNVGFCDGHAEFISRKEAISQRYSGHPLPDPPGF